MFGNRVTAENPERKLTSNYKRGIMFSDLQRRNTYAWEKEKRN